MKHLPVVLNKNKILKLSCASFLLGVAIASGLDWRAPAWLGIGLVLLLGGLIVFKTLSQKLIFGLLFLFIGGLYRYQLVFPPVGPERLEYFAPQKVTVHGVITAEPDIRLDSAHYLVAATSVESRAGPQKVAGNFLVVTDRYPQFQYGDVVKVGCQLRLPEPIIDTTEHTVFRYDLTLARQQVFVLCQNPRLTLISAADGKSWFSLLLRGKKWLATQLAALWPEPYASFMAGLLYGYRGGLGPLNDLFSRTGVAHIVAVSGFNISVIATLFLSLCTWLHIKRQHAFWLTLGAIIFFVLFTGASASVVRAGIMGGLVLLAKQTGRASQIDTVLLVTATSMIILNPLILWYDAGFQLSFLATLGLVYLNPLLAPRLLWLPKTLGLQENTTSTLAATIITLPLILHQFGRLAVLTVFVNILVLWIIPWLMAAGFGAIILGAISLPVAQVVAWIPYAGMWYVIKVVSWFGTISWAAPEVSFSLAWLVVSYCGLALWIYKYYVPP